MSEEIMELILDKLEVDILNGCFEEREEDYVECNEE